MPRDYRSQAATEYRKLYKTASWQKARKVQLSKEPLCYLCSQEGKVVQATVVNHAKPHKGDWSLFIAADNHQSVCKPHHDGVIQSYERTGTMRPAIGLDGWPVEADPKSI